MRYIEIDGKRYDVPGCWACPCYSEGNDYDRYEECRHPVGAVCATCGGRDRKGEEVYGHSCPLRTKLDMAEGGFIGPSTAEAVFLDPPESNEEREAVVPESVLKELKEAMAKPCRTLIVDEPKVATIECEVMERALTYICNLFEELEQAIEHSEPIKQGIYLERLRNAILSQREEMVRRQVEERIKR